MVSTLRKRIIRGGLCCCCLLGRLLVDGCNKYGFVGRTLNNMEVVDPLQWEKKITRKRDSKGVVHGSWKDYKY